MVPSEAPVQIVLAVDAVELDGFTSPRTFNALLSGAFVLAHWCMQP